MKTTLYLLASLSPRVKNWVSVLEEEGYNVVLVDVNSKETVKVDPSKEYGIVTVGISDDVLVDRILSIDSHLPKLAIHCGPQSLKPFGDISKTAYPVVFHLAHDQSDILAHLASLPDSDVSLPPSSADDDVAETPLAYTGKRVRVYQYPSTAASRAEIWATSLPFASQTAEYAFGEEVNEWERSAAGLIYTRNIEAIKQNLGPCYDLERLWERHTRFEFVSVPIPSSLDTSPTQHIFSPSQMPQQESRDAKKTMATMILEPYVNHVSCMTGGTGYKDLLNFYSNNFVTRSPPDTELVPISRTIGADRIVDEMVFRCTHTCEVEYFLPGVAPTNKKLEIFMVAIVNFRGPKLAFESLYWDHASALVQSECREGRGGEISKVKD
jgi:hypothetical protein